MNKINLIICKLNVSLMLKQNGSKIPSIICDSIMKYSKDKPSLLLANDKDLKKILLEISYLRKLFAS